MSGRASEKNRRELRKKRRRCEFPRIRAAWKIALLVLILLWCRRERECTHRVREDRRKKN